MFRIYLCDLKRSIGYQSKEQKRKKSNFWTTSETKPLTVHLIQKPCKESFGSYHPRALNILLHKAAPCIGLSGKKLWKIIVQ